MGGYHILSNKQVKRQYWKSHFSQSSPTALLSPSQPFLRKKTQRHRALHLYGGGLLHDDDLSPLVRDSDAEILTGRPASAYSSTNLGSQIESLHLLQESNKKPPGLSQEVFDCLNPEIFSSTEMGVEGLELGASQDCSICLESFMDGDKLICLPCEHRFHAACLSPWAHIRGDCPYCRKVIVVDSQTAKRNT
ncbi:E3 ubiquitin-protein ligase DZIP3-like [Pyrus ussuriensis x Pyrus communis]|uniref:E3 ubiquitin-protein ligase DZIP3-like n=1 Tax=Pyrus ussuriensis x Pyrus communis TaxID=2448454 RepID=A0A5N5IBL7_9ROSA|nr:E3 ubiquitin-protein ligase DZIP3-like [Pyrus ussuriensis x Pyrus communis]